MFFMFPNVSMSCPIIVYLIVGLCSHSYVICIKIFMVINAEEVCQMSNKW